MKLLERVRRVGPSPTPSLDVPDWSGGWILILPGLLILFQFVPLILAVLGFRWTLAGLLLSAMASDALVVGIAWLALCSRSGRSFRSLGLKPPLRNRDLVLRPVVGSVLVVVALFLASTIYFVVSGGRMPPPQRSVQVLGGVQSLGLKILAVAAVGLAAPVAEEILFRGVVFRGLRWRMTGTSAYVLSAIFFSLAHLDPDHFLHLFGIGLVLAWTVDRSHSLYPGMILHGAINLTSLWTLW